MNYSDIGLTSDFFTVDSLAVVGTSSFDSPNAITTGAIRTGITIGRVASGYIRMDGLNRRITVNDGTNSRVLIGYGTGLF